MTVVSYSNSNPPSAAIKIGWRYAPLGWIPRPSILAYLFFKHINTRVFGGEADFNEFEEQLRLSNPWVLIIRPKKKSLAFVKGILYCFIRKYR